MGFSAMPILGAMLDEAVARLSAAGRDEARLQCEWLASAVAGCARLELPLRRAKTLAETPARRLLEGVERLCAGEPLQYVLGESDFMGYSLKCDARALIPRPETEQLVAWMLASRNLWRMPLPLIADVGVGSGCIAVALALQRPDGHYLAIDVSAAALELARENAARHNVQERIVFQQGNLLAGVPAQSLDAIAANLPYVRSADWAQLEQVVRDYEPRLALDGGADGLLLIRRLVREAGLVLRREGLLFLEVGAGQGAEVARLLSEAGFDPVELRADLAGVPRLISAKKRIINA